MGRKEIKITRRFISETLQLLKVFGTVRYESFLLYLCLYFGIGKETSEDLTEKLLQARIITKAKYADTHIIKVDKKERASSDKLDAFDVYLAVMKEEKEKGTENEVAAVRMDLPEDFIFYTTTGFMYDVIINDDRGAQKLRLLEKFEKKRKKGEIILFAYPSRIPSEELKGLKKPVISGRHRLAIVRKSPETGIATCILTDIEGKDDRQR